MFNQKRNLKYTSLFLICFFISTALFLNSCGRFFIKDEGLEKKSIGELSVDRAVDRGCLIKNASPFVKSSADNTTSTLAVAEITQTAGGNGYYGSFVVPSNGISFLLSVLKDKNGTTKFFSLSDPDGTDILSSSSTQTLNGVASGSLGANRYANVLVPQSPSFSAEAGTWSFVANNNDRVKLALRSGNAPTSTTIVVQPYITGTTWSAGDISVALIIMKRIYSKNGITLTVKSTITISETQYATVSKTFTDSTTSALVSQGSTAAVNLFFIEDYSGSGSGILGNAAGIPGSMGITNSWNGVLNSLSAHASGAMLDAQLLGETAAHEMGHQLGLFHTTESGGTQFDILSDTLECQKSTQDNNSDWKVSAEECEGYGGENLMFWTSWSSSSRSAGKKQEVLCNQQQQVLKYSPLAK